KEKENSDLIKYQIEEYRNFIDETLKGGSIMQKTFYVSVPFSLMEASSPAQMKSAISELTEDMFQRAKNQLLQRAEFVILGLRSCSLDAVPLNTLEVSELLWALYHPIEAERGFYPDFPSELIE
ncbi:MAG: hypothetical protein Q8N69_02770, partial [bacterium]|nr:hypothetical protein [bacterium]